MSEPLEVPEDKAAAAQSIGSEHRSLIRLSALILICCAVLYLHYLFLSKLTEWALLVLVGSWLGVLLRIGRTSRSTWVDFVLKDSAYGVVTDSGIKYRSLLRPRLVPWSSVERIEYSPRNGQRIDVFKVRAFTFSQVRPIHFGPVRRNGNAVREIEKILSQQGGSEKLVITDSLPEKFFHL